MDNLVIHILGNSSVFDQQQPPKKGNYHPHISLPKVWGRHEQIERKSRFSPKDVTLDVFYGADKFLEHMLLCGCAIWNVRHSSKMT